jgi:hypothetical protein
MGFYTEELLIGEYKSINCILISLHILYGKSKLLNGRLLHTNKGNTFILTCFSLKLVAFYLALYQDTLKENNKVTNAKRGVLFEYFKYCYCVCI